MKKSVSRSFLKVLSVTAAAAAILTLTGCVEEPASTSPASSPTSSSASSSSTSTSTSTAPSSKTEQEATSTSQNPELPASSSSEASSTPASSEVKTQPGDTAKEPAKAGETVEVNGMAFQYMGMLEPKSASGNRDLLTLMFAVENKDAKKTLTLGSDASVWEEIVEETSEDEEISDDIINRMFQASPACFETYFAGKSLQTASYSCPVTLSQGDDSASVFVCVLAPKTWSAGTIEVRVKVDGEMRYFKTTLKDIS